MRSHPARLSPYLLRIALPIVLAGALGRPAGAAVVLNEFERASGFDTVEVFNNGAAPVDLTGWAIRNNIGVTVGLAGILPAGGYQTGSSAGLVLEGGQIELIDISFAVRDEVAFGDEGGAPLPPLTPGFSCGRSPNGSDSGDDARDWNLDPTATLAAANDHPGATLGGPVSINELGPFFGFEPRGIPTCPVPVVELHNASPLDFELPGWWLSDGRQVWVLQAGLLPAFGWALPDDAPPGFCPHETGVLYLFAPGGQRVDQIGILGAPPPSGSGVFSLQRIPDGGGPRDGYDYPTSGGGSEWFLVPPTFGFMNQGPVAAGEPAAEPSTWGMTKARYR